MAVGGGSSTVQSGRGVAQVAIGGLVTAEQTSTGVMPNTSENRKRKKMAVVRIDAGNI